MKILRTTDNYEIENGSYFFNNEAKFRFRNDLPPESVENKESLKTLVDCEVVNSKDWISPTLNNFIKYFKALILISVGEK